MGKIIFFSFFDMLALSSSSHILLLLCSEIWMWSSRAPALTNPVETVKRDGAAGAIIYESDLFDKSHNGRTKQSTVLRATICV